jgi:AAA domain
VTFPDGYQSTFAEHAADDGVCIVTAEEFAAVDEPGAGALIGTADEAVLFEDANAMVYGDGGAGKTTLAHDAACHLAAGDDWLWIPVPRPVRVLLVEGEGSRAMYRRKVRRKLDGWRGSPLGRRLLVHERPWAKLRLDQPEHRRKLADRIREFEVDVLIIGPVSRIGMHEAGTLQDVAAFMELVEHLRALSGRRLAVVLIHHEGRSGKVSGAWEGSGDTLIHVQAMGHGRTRITFQKTRNDSSRHGTSLNLRWTDGEGYEVEDLERLDPSDVADLVIRFIRENPGTTWGKVEGGVPGVGRERRMATRDRLFAAGELVNVVRQDGRDVGLGYCPERRPSRLFHTSDPTIRHLLPASGADGEQIAPASGEGGDLHLLRAPGLKKEHGVGADASPADRASTQHGGRPLLGDPNYPTFIAEAGNNGHITEREFDELLALHKLAEKARQS